MISGVYKIEVLISENNWEPNYLGIEQQEDGTLKGYVREAYFAKPKFKGTVEEDGSFKLESGWFATIMADVVMWVNGKVDGDSVSGEVILGRSKFDFKGEKISEYVSLQELEETLK